VLVRFYISAMGLALMKRVDKQYWRSIW